MYHYVNPQAMLTEIPTFYVYKLIPEDVKMISVLTYN